MPVRTHRLVRAFRLAVLTLLVAGAVTWVLVRQARREPVARDDAAARPPAWARGDDSTARLVATTPREAGATERVAVASTPSPTDDVVTVSVATRDSYGLDAAPVPRIAFQIECGSAAAESARVVATGRTDDEGKATVSVPRSALVSANGSSLLSCRGRVVEPGYQRRMASCASEDQRREPRVQVPLAPPATTGPAASLRVVLIAFEGFTLAGEVVDEAGRPAKSYVWGKSVRPLGGWENRCGTPTDASGEFEIHDHVTRPLTLLADAGSRGSGIAAVATLPPAPEDGPLRIVVHAPGLVRGRVTDGSGLPSAGLELLVVQAELDDDRGSFVLPEPRATDLAMEGRGRPWATLSTSADGTFEATGLRADRYVVRARTGATSHYPHLLTATPVSADGAPLELELRSPHVLVRLVYADGKPFAGTVETQRRPRWLPGEAASVPRLDVTVARSDAHSLEPFEDAQQPLRSAGPGTFAFSAIPGRGYAVALHGGDLDLDAREVRLAADDVRAEVVLVARSGTAAGVLRVRPQNTRGEPLRGPVALRLEEEASGFRLIDDVRSEGESTWITRRVPAGRYLLVVECAPFVDFMEGELLQPRVGGGSSTRIEIRSGETTSLEPVLGAGARLTVIVSGRADGTDRDALTKNHPTMEVWNLDEWASQVTLQLRAQGRWPTPVDFRYDGSEPNSMNTHVGSYLAFGDERTSELLASGTYTLEARTRGGRSATVPVELVDGQTTSVRLEIPER